MLLFPQPRSAEDAGAGRRKTGGWWTVGLLVVAAVGVTLAVLWAGQKPSSAEAQAEAKPAVETKASSEVKTPSQASPVVSATATPATPSVVVTVVPAPAHPALNLATPTTQPAVGMVVAPTTQPSAFDPVAELNKGFALLVDGKNLEARALLSALYVNHYAQLAPADAQAIRDTLTSVNKDLVLGPKVTTGDELTEYYQVQAGDVLSRIALKYRTPYALLEQVNKVEAKRIRAGQKLKVVKGPFAAVVRKSEFRMDFFLNDAKGQPVYVMSLPVGLGKNDATPAGAFIVAVGGKVSNPGWTDPNTNKYFAPDDPANPVGEYWIGLEGTDEATKNKRGYGIHGTIEPESIGKQMSHGCVRMRDADIAQTYKMLTEKHSSVRIEP